MDKLSTLTIAVLREANRQRMSVGAVRLVKLLYLIEVEVYKHHDHKVTDCTWRYYLFGPFPDEFRTLEKAGILIREDVPITENRIFHGFSVDEEAPDLRGGLTWENEHFIPSLVKQWGDASLNTLLNYVYFHTAPMRAAKSRGEILDFSTIRSERQQRPTTQEILPKAEVVNLGLARNALRRFVERERTKPQTRLLSPRKDQVYFNALETLDRAERTTVKGQIEIIEGEFPHIASQK